MGFEIAQLRKRVVFVARWVDLHDQTERGRRYYLSIAVEYRKAR